MTNESEIAGTCAKVATILPIDPRVKKVCEGWKARAKHNGYTKKTGDKLVVEFMVGAFAAAEAMGDQRLYERLSSIAWIASLRGQQVVLNIADGKEVA